MKAYKLSSVKLVVSVILLLLCVCVLALFYSFVWRGQSDISETENRTLTKVPKLSLNDFATEKFQDKLENSISDQLLLSSDIKYGVKQFFNYLTSKLSSIVTKVDNLDTFNDSESNNLKSKKKYIYTEVKSQKLYKLDDSGYIISKQASIDDYIFNIKEYVPAVLDKVKYPKYLYFVESSLTTDFNNIEKSNIFEIVKTKFNMTDYARLTFDSFEEYKKYFYQTDHHWNYRGSYTGYRQIIRMMLGPDEALLVPYGKKEYNTIYNGSTARDNLLRCSTEKFTVYLYHIPPYKTYINDVEKVYGRRSRYVSEDDCPNNLYTNHYGLYYGDDYAKVVYDFNSPEKENLLIISTSYSNAVNDLIASHFNKTHVLDFRHYDDYYGTRIDVSKYMEDNNITKLLIIGNLSSLANKR